MIFAVLAMIATSYLLVIGTFAWKMVVDGLEGKPESEKKSIEAYQKARS